MAPLIESLERRRLLAGVTVVTHGFGGSADGWVTAMGNLIAQQSGALAAQPRYRMTVQDEGDDGGPITVQTQRLGPVPSAWGSAEVIVLLDWSDVAGSLPFGGSYRSTNDVAVAVAGELLRSGAIGDGATLALAALPMHLIGHSRGASLMSEVARRVGERGAWVEHLTFLDPHPVDGVREPFGLGINWGDPAMRVYENVIYADDFWRSEGSTAAVDVTGEAVLGAHNLQLIESVLADGGSSLEHSDVHTWYHGTIGPPAGPFPAGDGAIGAAWYDGAMGPRAQQGWRSSRLGRGDRFANGSKFSGAAREALTLSASGPAVWDNVNGVTFMSAGGAVQQGSPLGVSGRWEDRNLDATITLGLDRDDDPFNGTYGMPAAYATSAQAAGLLSGSIATDGIAGRFNVYATIGNGTTARAFPAPQQVTITVPGYTHTWAGPAGGAAWGDAHNWSAGTTPAAGDRVAIHDSQVALASPTRVAALQLTGGARLDLGANSLVIDYPSTGPLGTWDGGGYTGVNGLIAAGQLFSSAAQGTLTRVAAVEASAALGLGATETALWNGQMVDATSVLITLTFGGDATLDGRINIDDYGRIDSMIGQSGSVRGWFNGDFNFDGTINIDDYGIIDSNLAQQGAIPALL